MIKDITIKPKILNNKPILIATSKSNVFFDIYSIKQILGMTNIIYKKDEDTVQKVISFLNINPKTAVLEIGAGKSKMKFLRFDVASMLIMSFKPSFDSKLNSISQMKEMVDEYSKECPLFKNHNHKQFKSLDNGYKSKFKTSREEKKSKAKLLKKKGFTVKQISIALNVSYSTAWHYLKR